MRQERVVFPCSQQENNSNNNIFRWCRAECQNNANHLMGWIGEIEIIYLCLMRFTDLVD